MIAGVFLGGRSLVWILAFLTLAVPTSDLLAFGLHEHVAAAPQALDEPANPGSNALHHCELWMNPSDVAPTFTLFPPASVADLGAGPRSPRLVSRPFVPFTPPRVSSIIE